MAKKSMLEREAKKARLVEKYSSRRLELKRIIKSSTDFDTIMEAQAKLAKLPVNSSAARHSTRCNQCGRPHAVYRKLQEMSPVVVNLAGNFILENDCEYARSSC